MLWFDVEKRYNTTLKFYVLRKIGLWFDVEKRYNTTGGDRLYLRSGCGLM